MTDKEIYVKAFLPKTYEIIKDSETKEEIIDELVLYPMNLFKDIHDEMIKNFPIEFQKQIEDGFMPS